MPEEIETGVEAEKLETPKLEASQDIGERLAHHLEQLRNEKGLDFGAAFENVSRGLTQWLSERAGDGSELARLSQEKLHELDLDKTEIGKALADGLQKLEKLLDSGAEVIGGERAQAVVALLSLALLLYLRPEAALDQIMKNPELLTDSLKQLGFA